jgi:hypothetical protein
VARDALSAVHDHMDAVNTREQAQVLASQHFPFVHLWPDGLVSSGSNAEEFTTAMAETASSKGQQVGATPTGWSHSTITGVEEIIAGDEVVSYRVEFSRHSADGTTLGHCAAIWIATKQHDVWGIQFRNGAFDVAA